MKREPLKFNRCALVHLDAAGRGARRTFLAALAVFLACAPAASAKPKPFLLGLVDDSSAFARPQQREAISRLGLTAVRAVVHYRPGMRAEEVELDSPEGVRVILSVLGPSHVAPVTVDARKEYTDFLVALIGLHPEVRDVVVWNEPGTRSYFWPRGIEGPIERYVRLMRECYEALHPLGVRIIGLAAHVPLREMTLFARAIAVDAAIWNKPLMDVIAVHPYDLTGQTRRVLALFDRELMFSAQPSPARGLRLWYTEHGGQSRPPEEHRHLYEGAEDAAAPSVMDEGAHARFVKRHVTDAYCTPGVEAYFSFLIRDEANMSFAGSTAGFQTGLMRPDWTPKPAFTTMRSLATQVRRGTLRCSAAQ